MEQDKTPSKTVGRICLLLGFLATLAVALLYLRPDFMRAMVDFTFSCF